ncbi:MAG: Gfo/Idh/MocA family oxidoreductase [Verrucomicrobiota bacterium]
MNTTCNRRHFLRASGLLAAAGTIQFLPGHVLGLNGATAPNAKLNLAGIGVGGQGGSDIAQLASENIVALCDVDWDRAAGTFKKNPNAKKYKDYRKLLDEQKDIDAVVVATPDHMHAFATTAALQLGKHVYCEKPLTHDVWEARQVAELARAKKVATQMGNQGQASEETRRLCEFIWDGAIGPAREAHIWTDRPAKGLFKEYWPQGIDKPADTPPPPANLDWDLWIGSAPMRPYNPAYMPFKWRGWWDFGTGALGDIGCHAMDPVFRALKLKVPLSVQASSSRVNTEAYPAASMVTYEYPARGEYPALKLIWYDGGLRPPRPHGLPEGEFMGDNGRMIIGDKGFILGNKLFPLERRAEYPEPAKTIPRSPGHHLEWINACKGGPAAGSNFDWAGPLTEAVLLGNVALRVQLREDLTRAKLLWNSEKLQFTNLPEANEFLRRKYRDGWSLG